MTTFADTSALYAVLDRADDNHATALRTMAALRDRGAPITHSYVVLESAALAHRRLGFDAATVLHDELLPLIDIERVGADLHDAAWRTLRAARRRRDSLVDHVSFELMRRRRIDTAFAFDDDFVREGFALL